jgi:hypothetical protein
MIIIMENLKNVREKIPTRPLNIEQPYKYYPAIRYPIIEHNKKFYRLNPSNSSVNFSNSTLIKCNPLLYNEEVIPLILKSKKIKFIWIIGSNKKIEINQL